LNCAALGGATHAGHAHDRQWDVVRASRRNWGRFLLLNIKFLYTLRVSRRPSLWKGET